MPRVHAGGADEAVRVASFRPAPQDPLRDRIIAAAAHVTTYDGWAAVTMARLADLVGVSRQTVYNEIGAKSALADAMVQTELARFLSLVTEAFAAHPGELIPALREAVEQILTTAAHNPLLQAIVSAGHGGDTELLPLLTSRNESLVITANAAILAVVAPFSGQLTGQELTATVDVVVRTVLSHVVHPGGEPADTADGLTSVVAAVFDRAAARR